MKQHLETHRQVEQSRCVRGLFAALSSSALSHARIEITAWKEDYNCNRPHFSLGNITPKEFAIKWL